MDAILCEKCGAISYFDDYFQKYICSSCRHSQDRRNLSVDYSRLTKHAILYPGSEIFVDDYEVTSGELVFKNGSKIKIIHADESARSNRCNDIEFVADDEDFDVIMDKMFKRT